jgi:hypothetical protein
MSKQPKMQLPISGGYWQILAHLPSPGALQYSAALHMGNEIVCNVFCLHSAELITDSLILDSTYITLNTQSDYELVATFLADTASYIGVAA